VPSDALGNTGGCDVSPTGPATASLSAAVSRELRRWPASAAGVEVLRAYRQSALVTSAVNRCMGRGHGGECERVGRIVVLELLHEELAVALMISGSRPSTSS